MKFSPQQRAFIDWAAHDKGSCVLEAVAGAGKTTTLLAAARAMRGDIAICAFNKKIAEEIKEKTQGDRNIKAGTVHSFGFGAYRNSVRDVKLERNKSRDIINTMFPQTHPLAFHSAMIENLVSLAKQRALGVIGSIDDTSLWYDIAEHHDIFSTRDGTPVPEEDIIAASKAVLKKSAEITAIIDFNDMVFMPLYKGCNFKRYDVVMVDEAQDTNPARRAMVAAMLKKGGRVIAVGDRHQAIYGFTGADNNSLDLIAQDFNAVRLPLTTTYRCPKKIVAFAQQWVSHIHAHESAPEGSITSSDYETFVARTDLNADSAVLCRNTAPLVAVAMNLIRRRIPCKIEGRDVGKSLIKLAFRWRVRSLDALRDKLDAHFEAEQTKLLAKKKEDKIAQLEDQIETLKVIIDQCQAEKKNNIADLEAYIEELFSEDVKGMMVLSTIHKSKGREWERVFWLDRHKTCPSKWARQQWQKDQETNLMYVAATRAKAELIELTSPPKDAPVPAAAVTKKAVAAVLATPPAPGLLSKEDQRKADKARRAKARREARKARTT